MIFLTTEAVTPYWGVGVKPLRRRWWKPWDCLERRKYYRPQCFVTRIGLVVHPYVAHHLVMAGMASGFGWLGPREAAHLAAPGLGIMESLNQ